MKTASIILMSLALFAMVAPSATIHDFTVKDIDGNDTKLETYAGKVVLIVNVASKCGNTKQYTDLQQLYETYKDQGLVILGFPANNFGGQEPGSNEEIKLFCSETYNVSFPMFSKVSVKGDDIHPLFDTLIHAENPDFTGDVAWNFEKFLVGKDGELKRRFHNKLSPSSDEIVEAIESLLAD